MRIEIPPNSVVSVRCEKGIAQAIFCGAVLSCYISLSHSSDDAIARVAQNTCIMLDFPVVHGYTPDKIYLVNNSTQVAICTAYISAYGANGNTENYTELLPNVSVRQEG